MQDKPCYPPTERSAYTKAAKAIMQKARKCNRVLDDQRSLATHEKESLVIEDGESFLKYDVRKSYDASSKFILSSQPFTMTPAKCTPTQPEPFHQEQRRVEQPSELIKCDACHI